MSYTIQIEPLLTTKMNFNNNNKSIETTKRQSLYTRIRYASKLLRLRTEIRKHRTLPNDFVMIQPTTHSATKNIKNYCYGEEDDEEVDSVTIFDEKEELLITKNYSLRGDSQLALPSRLKYFVTTTDDDTTMDDHHLHYMNDYYKDEEEEEDVMVAEKEQENTTTAATCEYDDDDSEDEDTEDLDNYMMDTSPYTATLQKLSGISFNNKKNTAVLITLSPCALAAANAARQKRQKIRISH